MIDFKIVEEREIDGLVYQKVRFYEGDITTENENRFDETAGEIIIEPVTRYRRTALIETREYWYDN